MMTNVLAVVGFCLGLAQMSNGPAIMKQDQKMAHVSGTFDVKVAPLAVEGQSGTGPFSRMSLDKKYHGDLDAVAVGQMLAAGTAVKESAGYVAIEQVTGTLQGRRGSFILQHSGIMNRGEPQLTISVVPDSGTDGLIGLAGTMQIRIAEGKHFYQFDYTVPSKP